MKKVLKVEPLNEANTEDMHHYRASGLDNYWLSPELYRRGQYDGMPTIRFPKLREIHAAIGRHVCSLDRHLGPREIQFLRIQMGLSQADIGKALGYKNKQLVAAAEKQGADRKPLHGVADLFLRSIYLNWLGGPRIFDDEFIKRVLCLAESLKKPHLVESQNWQIVA